jgi:hypothetical protein
MSKTIQHSKRARSKRLVTPIKILNEYMVLDSESSSKFINSIDSEIEALRAKLLSVQSIENDFEDDLKFELKDVISSDSTSVVN